MSMWVMGILEMEYMQRCHGECVCMGGGGCGSNRLCEWECWGMLWSCVLVSEGKRKPRKFQFRPAPGSPGNGTSLKLPGDRVARATEPQVAALWQSQSEEPQPAIT